MLAGQPPSLPLGTQPVLRTASRTRRTYLAFVAVIVRTRATTLLA